MNDLHELIQRMLENRLSASESERLAAILRENPEARRHYAEQCQLHARLLADGSLKSALKMETPIDLDESSESPEVERAQGKLSRFPAYIGIVAASAAISFVAVVTLLNFSRPHSAIPFVPPAEKGLSPQEVYARADFPDSGNLKRPPTNFASITPQDGKERIRFNRDIRPILSENCYHCHGPDANTREADLRLDIEANAFLPHGDFDAPIVRGDPKASPLYQRIVSQRKSEVMPPPDSHKSLTELEKNKIRQWIVEGAEWEGHWAFIPPRKPSVPKSTWGTGPIDAFTYAKMTSLSLKPNDPADRATIARRLSLDLRGLPMDPREVEMFVSDRSENAYEKLVDRLLSDPAYGEHQARIWLDAARYSDTHGLHLDNYREIWPYRDWVVKAFNENKPFDEFVVEQIAGDLLPNPTIDQIIATGFNRCNPTTSEGGAIDDEYRAIYAKDRVETTSTVFLGLTIGCASCHDHKFDPVTRKDFYQLSAFFNNIDGPIMDGNAYDTKPIAVIPKPEHEKEWRRIQPLFESGETKFEELKKSRQDAHASWLESKHLVLPEDLVEEIARYQLDDETETEKDELFTFKIGESIELSESLNAIGKDSRFTLTFDYKTPTLEGEQAYPILSKFDGNRGWRISMLKGDTSLPDRYRLRFELIHSLKDNDLISITTQSSRYQNPVPGNKSSITITYDGSGLASGISIGTPSRRTIDDAFVVDNLSGDFQTEAPLLIHPLPTNEDSDKGVVSEIRFYEGAEPLYKFVYLNDSKSIKEAFEKEATERRERENTLLENYYFEMIDPVSSKAKSEFESYSNKYNYIYDLGTVSLVMKEKDTTPSANILIRGEYDKVGEKVLAQVPEVFGKLPADEPLNRMDLAQWLVDPENPLTARVTVNRIWQNFFGTGIVKTSEDFGVMGENPSHPELLDWLAINFQENDWDVKKLITQIVTSSTYRQDSKFDKTEHEIDPENRYLARGPRYRLDAETLRDQALFVSGSLIDDIGGPPVKPYQPSGIWNAVAYSGSNTRFYEKDQGDALYRRSLYTFWKRTAPPPNMIVFDAPSRESCSVRRDRTNTPLQALTLMNDPQFVEAARHLAERAADDNRESDSVIIEKMYQLALGMPPPESHLTILLQSYSTFEKSFEQNPKKATQLISTGDSQPDNHLEPVRLASLTMVANQIMNLDSFVNKF